MIASRYHWLSHVVFNFNLHGLLQILIDTTGVVSEVSGFGRLYHLEQVILNGLNQYNSFRLRTDVIRLSPRIPRFYPR